jgi:phospholipase A1
MRSLIRRTTLVLALVSSSAAAAAFDEPGDCALISEPELRLACFDDFFPAAPGDGGKTRESPIEARAALERESLYNWFAITPHRPNYILPVTHNFSPDFSPYGALGEFFEATEIKYQLSLKTRILPKLWRGSSLWFAYTQLSLWQLYADEKASSPFRETNHEPELRWRFPVDFEVLGWDAKVATLALSHQSNGRSGELSRSWNRVVGELAFERGQFVAAIRAWSRIPEDPETDDNPDIEDYMGRMELGAAYRGEKHSFAIGIKNNLSSDNRSGVELHWMFPLAGHLKGYVQAYSGYGETLIDAENYTNRIGVGISLTDWL